MTQEELQDEARDRTIPILAVEALSAASKRALQAGHTVVYVKNHHLIRKDANGEVVLKIIPRRLKVKSNGNSANS